MATSIVVKVVRWPIHRLAIERKGSIIIFFTLADYAIVHADQMLLATCMIIDHYIILIVECTQGAWRYARQR